MKYMIFVLLICGGCATPGREVTVKIPEQKLVLDIEDGDVTDSAIRDKISDKVSYKITRQRGSCK